MDKLDGIPQDIWDQALEVLIRHGHEPRWVDRIIASQAIMAERSKEKPVLFDFLTHLYRQRNWSEQTFGPGSRAKGVVDHIRKELTEIEQNPADLEEWIDVVILGFDGAWREGYSPEQIIAALEAKQAKNEARNWPDWRTAVPDKAIEHDRSGE